MNLMKHFIAPPEFAILPMQQSELRDVAAIHASGFARGWTDGEIAQLLARDGTFGKVARPVGKKGVSGFILYTLVAGEGEILTVATAPNWRRYGIGEMLVKAALSHLSTERAEALFLEVGDSNTGALALYRKHGFVEVGKRQNYYSVAKGESSKGNTSTISQTGATALVMRRDLL
jgi:[ribosomal protein S18]-alanine N-acetyltransferase